MEKKTDWVTRTLKKKGKCVACWREFAVGDTVVTPIKDEVMYTHLIYCPRGVEHIDNLSDYKNYLKDHKGITDESKLIYLGHKWEMHRIRKGYLNIVDVKEVTKEHKEAYQQMLDFKMKRENQNLEKLYKKYKEEHQKILDQLFDLEDEKENL